MHPFRLKPAPAPAPTPAEAFPRPAAAVEPEPAAAPKPGDLVPHTAIEIGWTRGPHKNEANCLRYALRWRDDVLAAIATGSAQPEQLAFPLAA